jgi:metal-dependent amidase/aminoacylase/carboxypeptidase family protein
VAYRADMDACGHDAHMAIAISLIKVFSLIKDEIEENIKFIFQPAEETVGGSLQMIEDKALKNPRVDYIFGIHVWPPKLRVERLVFVVVD